MVIITNLEGDSLPLIDIDILSRTRGTNGEHLITMIVKRTERNYKAFDLIENESIITVDNNDYRVKILEKETVNETIELEITAQHVFYDNVDNYQYEIIPGEKVLSLHQALIHSLKGTGYTFIIKDEFTNVSFEDFGDDNSIALFEETKSKFDFEFDIENKHLIIVKRIGKKTNHQMRWKHNIKTIKQEDNTHNLATFIRGYADYDQESDKWNLTAEYTSPNAEKYGIRHAPPVKHETIKHEITLINRMKSRLIDYPEITFQIEYEQLANNINTKLENVDLGDTIYLIHELMNLKFETRIIEVVDFPLHPHIKPIYTISSTPLTFNDKQAMSIINKQNLEKQVELTHSKQNELYRRIEQTIEAVNDVNHTVDNVVIPEMERIENEVIPEIEQAVDSAKIPSQVEPPYPIPTSKLWWDTSVNPPRLKRWNGEEWVVLAPTEDEIDQIIEDMKDEAVRQGIEYTDAEVEAARQAIINRLDEQIGEVNVDISDLNDVKDNLIERANIADQRLDNAEESISYKLNTLDYQKDKTDILSSIENHTSEINALSDEINLRVTREEFDNLEIGGRNLLNNSDFSNGLEHWGRYSGGTITSKVIDDDFFGKVIEINKDNVSGWISNTSIQNNAKLSVGDKVTISFWLNTDVSGNISATIRTTGVSTHVTDSKGASLKNGWNKYVFILNTIRGSDTVSGWSLVLTFKTSTNASILGANFKAEKGNKATDWSPAPEDALERITRAEATLDIHSESIALKAEKSELLNYVGKQEYTNQMGELNVAIDGITSKVQNVEATVNDHTGEIESARSQIASIDTRVDGITSSVSDISRDLTTANQNISRIDQKADGIISTVSEVRTDIGELEGDMTAVQTRIEQLPSEINLAVSEGIDALEIGGRNLALGTSDSFRTVTISQYGYSGMLRVPIDGEKVSHGDEVTFSVYVKDIPNGEEVRLRLDWYRDDGTYSSVNAPVSQYTNKDGRLTFTAKVSSDTTFKEIRGRIMPKNWSSNYQIKIKEEQLEKGNKATDWSPAPEDGVNKTNVLSSINLSTEGVKIQGNKIDIVGLVSVLNADGTTGTMIQGGKIVGQSITANQLNINNIFGNSAVIAKIQSDSVRTAELSASMIRSGTLHANIVDVVNLNASNIKAGTLASERIASKSIDAGKLNVNELSAISGNLGTVTTGRLETVELIGATGDFSGEVHAGRLTVSTKDIHEVPRILFDGRRSKQSNIRWNANADYDWGFYITHEDTDVAIINKSNGLTILEGRLNVDGIRAINGNLFLRPSDNSSEVRVATVSGSYRPIRASNFHQSSSIEYKTNIENIGDIGLDTINSLTVLEYDLKADIENGITDNRQTGFIAEYSESVASKDKSAIDVYKLSAYNTKAIQELSKQNDKLQQENEQLKSRLDVIEEQLEQLLA